MPQGRGAATVFALFAVLAVALVDAATAAPLRLRVRARAWELSGTSVDRTGRVRERAPGASAVVRFGPQSDVESGIVDVALSRPGVELVLRGPFDPEGGARQDVDLDTGLLREAVLAAAAASQPDGWDPAGKLVTFETARLRTRATWRERFRGRRERTFRGLLETLRVHLKLAATVRDPDTPRARPIRVRTSFRGTFRREYASLGEPGPRLPSAAGDACPWLDTLAGRPILRDLEQEPPTGSEAETLEARDAILLADLLEAPLVGTYDIATRLVLSRAGIGDAPFCVVADLRAAGPSVRNFGGGVAGHEVLTLDGKLLDILAEYARYRVLAEDDRAPRDDDAALNAIVHRHNTHPGAAPDGFYYVADELTAEQAERARAYLTRSMAPIVYHEFGHHFLWAALDDLRARAGELTSDYLTTSLHEDDADRLAGALVRKSGGTADDIEFLYDTLSLYIAWREGSVTTIEQVRAAAFQDATPSARYASPAERKALAHGVHACGDDARAARARSAD